MTAVADPAEAPPKKSSKLPLILGLVLAVVGGAGGFLAVRMGLLAGGSHESADASHDDSVPLAPLGPMAYVAIEPLTINMPRSLGRQFLRFTVSLEVDPARVAEVETLKPRIVDVLNSYLRAIEPADFENQMILTELRAQLLRRIQVVTGEGRVRDLLIIEFVLN